MKPVEVAVAAATASPTILELVGIVTAILVLIMLVLQLLDRRDSKKSHDLTEPMDNLRNLITNEFHKGELLMQSMARDIAENKRDVGRVEREQERLREQRKSTKVYTNPPAKKASGGEQRA